VRILHVTDSFAPSIGGIERQVESLARYQVARGHDVTIVTAVRGDGHAEFDVMHSLVSRWVGYTCPPYMAARAHRALRRGKYDVVHAHLSISSPLAVQTARIASRRGIPVALTVHSLWPRSTASLRFANLPYWLLPIRGAWSAVGSVAAQHVAEALPTLREVHVVPNIVDTEWWRPLTALRATDPREIRIIAVGRLAGRKRVDALLDVFASVRAGLADGVDVRLSIVGDGPRRRRLHEQATALGISDRVEWLGQQTQDQIRGLLHDSDLFVAPAVRESFGIAALEARASGLPVIGLRGNGLGDFITDGLDGVLVEDDRAMAVALLELVNTPGQLQGLRDRTAATPPSMTAREALDAADLLYQHALGRGGEPVLVDVHDVDVRDVDVRDVDVRDVDVRDVDVRDVSRVVRL
jgi:glycosyltransferase involved in cell wall biosynthesis